MSTSEVSKEVHDIAWAAEQVRAGKCVTRPGWLGGITGQNMRPAVITSVDILATDWEVKPC